MNVLQIGYGKTGKLIKQLADERGDRCLVVDPAYPEADAGTLSDELLADVDVAIDFSHPSAAIANIEQVLASKTHLVVGTTGWYDQEDYVRSLVEAAGVGFVYASNFSPGVQIFFTLLKQAAALFERFEEYDVAGIEQHHNQKADAPSGTAHTAATILLEGLGRKDRIVFGSPDRKIASDELQFTSVRCGSIPGTHSIFFDSDADTITLSHQARNRSGFASGALLAAHWLQGKAGFFTIEDLISDLLKT